MAIHLQERDIALLQVLADDFLLLTRDQIQQVIPRRVRRTNQRLSILVNAGYISRREPQGPWEPRMVFYYLGEKAGDVLKRDRAEILERRNRAENYKTAFLKHLYQINTIHIRFWKHVDADYACQTWLGSDNTVWDKVLRLGLRPDSYVEFRKDEKDYCCFIEMDRGTERGEYIRKKIADYHRYDLSGEFRDAFEMDWFRVLFIVEQASRAKMLSKLFPSDTFLAATLDQVRTKPLFDPYWLTLAKKETSLLDTSGAELRVKEQKDKEREEELEELETPPPAPKPPRIQIEPKTEPEQGKPSSSKQHSRYREWGFDVLVAGIVIVGLIKLILIILSAISNLRDSLTGFVR